MWGQYQGTEFQKLARLQEKAVIIIKFLPNNAPVSKEMHILKILKLKDFITHQNILFVYDCLEEERRDFKTKKCGRFSILKKILTD